MKKTFSTLIFSLLFSTLIAGGIVTNTNQSASFLRNPAQGGKIGIESVYFNPAGLTKLNEGFHLSLNNQFIFQHRQIVAYRYGMERDEFIGKVNAPLFPSAYGVFKKNKFALSFGFNPIGGGGSATYPDGLPQFEYQLVNLKAGLNANNIPTTKFSYDSEFEGKSVYLGFQANASYQLSDMLSASLGLRYVTINNSYNGYLKDIQINPVLPAAGFTGNMVKAPVFFETLAGLFTNLAGVASSIAPLANNAQTQTLTLPQLVGAGLLTQAQATSIAGGFAFINPNANANALPIAVIHQAYVAATPTFTAQAAAMNVNKNATGDKLLDASQSGSGIVPVVGLNFNLDKLNFGFKYEHKASINVTNKTDVDDVGMYPDGAEVPSDIPSMFSFGFDYQPADYIAVSATYHAYIDKSARYGKMLNGQYVKNDQLMNRNFREIAFGVDVKPSEKLLLSIGYLFARSGVNPEYQSDLSHSLTSYSLGAGAKYNFTDNIAANLGIMNTFYNVYYKPINFPNGQFNEKYQRRNLAIGLGVDLSF